jgi:peroxin-3
MATPNSSPDLSSPSIRRLMDETSDLIDSPSFSHVLTLLLDSGFSLLVDTKIASLGYKMPLPSADTSRIHEIVGTDAKARLAQSIPVFSRQAHLIGSGSSNEYLSAMEAVRDLSAFAAVVYSSNFEYELPETAAENSGGVGSSTMPTPATKAAPGEPLPSDFEKGISLAEGDFQKAWEKATFQG